MDNKESIAVSFAMGIIIVFIFWHFYTPPLVVEKMSNE